MRTETELGGGDRGWWLVDGDEPDGSGRGSRRGGYLLAGRVHVRRLSDCQRVWCGTRSQIGRTRTRLRLWSTTTKAPDNRSDWCWLRAAMIEL